ncbi:recombinase family protein [Stenotrophomonas maltophilia]|nr:recombinase family protein [Stenotrophomonas maltophilia]
MPNKDQFLEAQLFALRDWAEARGHEVVAEYTDECISGTKGESRSLLGESLR